MKTIKTNDYYLVGFDKKLQTEDWYEVDNKILQFTGHPEIGDNLTAFYIIGHLPLNGAPKLDGVPLLMNREVDLPKFLYLNSFNEVTIGVHGDSVVTNEWNEWLAQQQGCFTLEVEKAWSLGYNSAVSSINEDRYGHEDKSIKREDYIQSLTPEWEYEVEMRKGFVHGHHDNKPKTIIINNEIYLAGKWKEVK